MENKILGNIDIKSLITVVALVLWMAYTGYGFFIGEFNTLFEFFKQVFMVVIAFYLGTKVGKEEASTEKAVEKATETSSIVYDAVYSENENV